VHALVVDKATFKTALAGYAIGVAAFALAFAVRYLSGGWFQSHYPFLTFFCAVIVTAYLGGLWPALTVDAAAAVVAYLTYARPSSSMLNMGDAPVSATVFFLTAALCAMLIASLRSARDRLELERQRYADLAENRDLLYRELQHRVSNNIQTVAGLLRVQASAASPSPRKALTEAADRIGLLARIQRDLHDHAGAPTPFRDFARDLLSRAVTAAGAESVGVTIEGGEEPLHPDQATPVCLVLLECVNNALEHAFNDGRPGAIRVELARTGAHWRLTISDNGSGPPPGLDVPSGSSLGLKIVRAMASQLQGEFSIADGAPGAVCVLTYPAHNRA